MRRGDSTPPCGAPVSVGKSASTSALLSVLHDVLGLRLGIITNVPHSLTSFDVSQLLTNAGVMARLDPSGVITSHDAQASKPDAKIFTDISREFSRENKN